MAIASILKKVFGSKADRDLKQIRPVLNKVLEAYGPIDKLSNDELRAKTEELKARLRECEAPFEKRIAEIKAKLDEDIPVHEKESLATESDKLVKEEDAEIEKVLEEILPEAFAIMKSTARRFKENATIEVTANDFDRALSINHDFVHIEGDKAVYQNHWIAGGNEVTWDMVHYDVQLIGGIVLGYIWQILINCVMTILEQPLLALNATAGYWGLIILMGWQQIGYMMIVYIAGLQAIPGSLNEAAMIDGASSFQTFTHIMLPSVKPVSMCVGVMSLVYNWNDFFNPLIYLNSTKNFTVSIGLQFLNSSMGTTKIGQMMAVALVMTLPVLVIFFVCQRYFVEGIKMQGIKG